PSASGQSVTFTATVSVTLPGSTVAGYPTGTVTVSDNGTSIGQGTLSTASGVTRATFSTSSLSPGTHTIAASYAGDSNFLTSTGTLLISSANPSTYRQRVFFAATVSIVAPGSMALANPAGVVIFSEGSTILGQGTLSVNGSLLIATFSTTTLSVGSHNLTASYSGDGN